MKAQKKFSKNLAKNVDKKIWVRYYIKVLEAEDAETRAPKAPNHENLIVLKVIIQLKPYVIQDI
ncbi:MAG: hypothetical protein SAK29_39700, partial [Scytonema sp. PMC 1069.18]|nr:hypothetical protein [Scytonema sp. PMC 1069.18]MEC4888349.1 hypothetical protein [Scytonema sp. PMC 1070.18]